MFRDVVLKSHTAPLVQDVTPARGDRCAVTARELQKQSHTLVVYCTDAKVLVSQCCYTYTYFEVQSNATFPTTLGPGLRWITEYVG